jgi:hypothetical protein
MAIGVHGDLDTMVTKLSLDIGYTDTLSQPERGIGVTQVMGFTVGKVAGLHNGTPYLVVKDYRVHVGP